MGAGRDVGEGQARDACRDRAGPDDVATFAERDRPGGGADRARHGRGQGHLVRADGGSEGRGGRCRVDGDVLGRGRRARVAQVVGRDEGRRVVVGAHRDVGQHVLAGAAAEGDGVDERRCRRGARPSPAAAGLTVVCSVTVRPLRLVVRVVAVGVAATTSDVAVDVDVAKAVGVGGHEGRGNWWVPRVRSASVSEADPADRVTVPTTVAPSLTWTLPAGVAPVAATVATRLAVRPETCPVSVVVVAPRRWVRRHRDGGGRGRGADVPIEVGRHERRGVGVRSRAPRR